MDLLCEQSQLRIQRLREFRGWEKRTSAAKAWFGGVIYGTAEAVPFPENRVLTQALKFFCGL
jgi:hypothetical protein